MLPRYTANRPYSSRASLIITFNIIEVMVHMMFYNTNRRGRNRARDLENRRVSLPHSKYYYIRNTKYIDFIRSLYSPPFYCVFLVSIRGLGGLLRSCISYISTMRIMFPLRPSIRNRLRPRLEMNL